jgi:hypothetical protein
MIANSARYSVATPRPTVAAVTILNKATWSRAAGCGLRSHRPVATTIVTVMPASGVRSRRQVTEYVPDQPHDRLGGALAHRHRARALAWTRPRRQWVALT